jgi:hypothetical protein
MDAAQRSFISSAYWTEGVGPAAAVASVSKMMRIDIPGHLAKIGRLMLEGWVALGRRHGLPVKAGGRPEMALLQFDHPDAASMTTFVTARMLPRGFLLGGGFNAMLTHEPWHVERCLEALDPVFTELKGAIDAGDLAGRIGGPIKHSHFARLT